MSIAQGLIWGYVERWGNKVISLIVFVVLARLLEPKDFGVVAFAKLFIDYLDQLGGQGLGLAIIQRKEVTSQHLSTAFWINVISGTALAALLFLLAPLIENIFAGQGVTSVLRAMAVLIVINGLSRVQVAILSREQRFRQLAIRGLVMSLSGGAVGVAMALQGYGVWSLVYQQLTAVVIALLILWGTTTWRPALEFNVTSAKEMYSFASRVVMDQQVLFLSKRLDEALISILLGVTLLGYYSIAKRIFETVVDMLYMALARVLLPVLAKSQDDVTVIASKVESVTVFIAAFSFPVFLAGAAASQEIIELIFGIKWMPAAMPFAILMLSGVFLLTPNVVHPVFHAVGKAGVPLKLNSLRALVSLVAISIGCLFGLGGAAVGALARNVAGASLDFLYLKREVGFKCISILRIQLCHLLYCLPMVVVIILMIRLLGWRDKLPSLSLSLFVAGVGTYLVTLALLNAQILTAGMQLLKNLYFRRK